MRRLDGELPGFEVGQPRVYLQPAGPLPQQMGWMPYIAVDNVDTRTAKAGAKVMKPAFDVPGVGRIVILMEPGGPGSAG